MNKLHSNSGICILTEGGAAIGIGHLTRCLSLCQAFEEKGLQPFFIVKGNNTVRKHLQNTRHELFDWQAKDPEILLKDTAVVIIDSYLAGIAFYKAASKAVKLAVYIDDNKRIDYPGGVVINGTVFAEELGYPPENDVSYLLGSKYIPLRKAFWDMPEKMPSESIQSILITFGGEDSRNLTAKTLELLHKDFPQYSISIIIGSSFKNTAQIESLKNSRTRLIYAPVAEEMKQAMLESDIAISAAGQTLYELAVTGVPTIAVAVAENQMNNVKGWQKAGFIEYAGQWDDSDLTDKIVRSIKFLQAKDARQKKSTIGKKYVDGQGARRIAEEILKKI